MVAYKPTSITASTSLTNRLHGDGGVVVNAAAGLTLTLPAATGSGVKFEIIIGTTVTSSNVVIQVANSSDIMAGRIFGAADSGDTVNGWEAGASDDTVTMNGTTKGGYKGDKITLRDTAANVWTIDGTITQTGTEATPFSAAV